MNEGMPTPEGGREISEEAVIEALSRDRDHAFKRSAENKDAAEKAARAIDLLHAFIDQGQKKVREAEDLSESSLLFNLQLVRIYARSGSAGEVKKDLQNLWKQFKQEPSLIGRDDLEDQFRALDFEIDQLMRKNEGDGDGDIESE